MLNVNSLRVRMTMNKSKVKSPFGVQAFNVMTGLHFLWMQKDKKYFQYIFVLIVIMITRYYLSLYSIQLKLVILFHRLTKIHRPLPSWQSIWKVHLLPYSSKFSAMLVSHREGMPYLKERSKAIQSHKLSGQERDCKWKVMSMNLYPSRTKWTFFYTFMNIIQFLIVCFSRKW